MRAKTVSWRTRLSAATGRVASLRVVQWARQTWTRWQEDDGSLMAAAVAFYAGLSFFPLLLVLISGLGWFFEHTNSGRDAEQQLLRILSEHLSPTLSAYAADALGQIRDKASVGGPLGFAVLLFAAMALFAHFERAFDRIWNVDDPDTHGLVSSIREIVTRRLLAFLMLLGLGVLLIAVFWVGVVFAALKAYSTAWFHVPDGLWWLGQLGINLALNSLIFTIIYRWLPKTAVSWADAFRGGAVAAAIWEIGRQVLTAWLIGNKYSSAYGVVGSFIGILLWSYYSVSVVFLGAEFIQAVCRHRASAQEELHRSAAE